MRFQKTIICFYDQTLSGSPWDDAAQKALAVSPLTDQQKRTAVVICLPKSFKNKKGFDNHDNLK